MGIWAASLNRRCRARRFLSVIAATGATTTIMLDPRELHFPDPRTLLQIFPSEKAGKLCIEMHAQRDRIVIHSDLQRFTRFHCLQRTENAPMALSPRNLANIDRKNLAKLRSHRLTVLHLPARYVSLGRGLCRFANTRKNALLCAPAKRMALRRGMMRMSKGIHHDGCTDRPSHRDTGHHRFRAYGAAIRETS